MYAQFCSFNEDVRSTVDEAIDQVDTTLWTKLHNRTSARDTSVATAEMLAREALDKIGIKIRIYFFEIEWF